MGWRGFDSRMSLGEEGVPKIEHLEIGPEFIFTGDSELAGPFTRNAEFRTDGVEGGVIDMVATHGVSLLGGDALEGFEKFTEDIALFGLIDGRRRHVGGVVLVEDRSAGLFGGNIDLSGQDLASGKAEVFGDFGGRR